MSKATLRYIQVLLDYSRKYWDNYRIQECTLDTLEVYLVS